MEQTGVTSFPRPRVERFRFLRELSGTLLFGVAVFVFFQLAIPQSMVDGRSMEPTFEDGQRLFISRVNYMVNDPQRGEIIVFNSPDPLEVNEPPLIKRIVGMPGDVVEIIETEIYVNGELLNEPYINEPCRNFQCPDNRWELGPNQYFLMGDNRNHSRDSRDFGPVAGDHIIGEAVLRFWPPQDFALLHRLHAE